MDRRHPRAEAKALRSGLFKQRIVKAKKGKGSYLRRPKHPGKGQGFGRRFSFGP